MSGRKRRLPSKAGQRQIKRAASQLSRGRSRMFGSGVARSAQRPVALFHKTPVQRYVRISGGCLLPQVLSTTFSYNDTWQETGAAGWAQYAFRANSLYDPDLSGIGGKAIGVTAMNQLYNRYRVTFAKFTLTYVNNDVNDPVHICIVPQKTSTALAVANKDAIPSQPGCVWDVVTNQTGKGTIVCKARIADLMGLNPQQESLTATFSNNPATEGYFIVYIFNDSGQALSGEATSTIEYSTVLSDIDYPNLTAA